MNAEERLREQCYTLYEIRKDKFKKALNNWLFHSFFDRNIPWRAVIGKKGCRPIPIYKDIYIGSPFNWPNLSEDVIKKELQELGFVIAPKSRGICIAVPPVSKGEKLTFAQEWVKKINHQYSKFCEREDRSARKSFEELIADLSRTINEGDEMLIVTQDGNTFFNGYKFEKDLSSKRALKYLRKLMKRAGIEEVYDHGDYLGIKVYHAATN